MQARVKPVRPLRARAGAACLVVASVALLVSACAHTPSAGHADPAGRIRGYVESSRVTDFCPDQASRRADERCVVTRGFDYATARTVVRMYDPDGKLIRTEHPPGANLSLTPAEQARVAALVRADPRTRAIVERSDVMFWSGGFVMREPGDRHCDRGSRCIRAIAAVDHGNDVILHSVVDLVTDRVVYPFYTPSGRDAVANKGKP